MHLAPRLDKATTLLENGRPGQAKAAFDQIQAEHPRSVALIADIAQRYEKVGRYGFAAQTWSQLAAFEPSAQVFNRLGDLYEIQDKPYKAMCAYRSAVDLDPSDTNVKNKFYESLRNSPARLLGQDALQIRKTIETCLLDERANHKRVMQTWVMVFLRELDLDRLLDCFKQPEKSLPEQDEVSLIRLLNSGYCTLGLRRIPVVGDGDFELLMTAARRYFLLSSSARLARFMPFICALAEHCFGNEYAFWVTDEEQEKLDGLREKIASIDKPIGNGFSKIDTSTLASIALLGSYSALQSFTNSEVFVQIASELPDPHFGQLVDLQIIEPHKRREIASEIPTLSNIEDEVSSAVRDMYEVNPYPRWRGISAITRPEYQQLTEGKNVLIAGCGTGQEAIARALRYPGASVLGIDLSLASLSYAKFMASRLGVENLELMQADILKAERIDRDFDLIFSSGVLHHMDDPLAGWRQLITRLRSGGVMQISLYSELARQDIVRCRDWIEEMGFDSSSSGIRTFRKRVTELDDDDPIKEITRRKDFYSLSHCRDLVFHVQEHRFTFPRLKQTLDALDLQLIGMVAPPWVQRRYHEMFPSDQAGRNFENWEILEQENPKAFWGMYTLWCCRAGETARLPEWLGQGG